LSLEFPDQFSLIPFNAQYIYELVAVAETKKIVAALSPP